MGVTSAAKAAMDKLPTPVIDDSVDYDNSTLLLVDSTPRVRVNEAAWWVFDAVVAFLWTFNTHPVWSLQSRLAATAFIIAFAFVTQKLYFNCGLDRPGSGENPVDKWWHMAITHIANTMFFWDWCVGVYDQVTYWRDNNTPVVLALLYAAAGFYFVIWACDLIAGFVHWFGDTTEMYFFQYHHKDPRYMTRQSYVHHTWDTFALGIFLSYSVAPVLRTTLIGMSIRVVACQANECHMWSHCLSTELPPLIKVLQELTLVLSWKAHKHHHKPPHLKDYCVFNGWANPFMNIVLPGPVTNGLANFRDTEFFQWVKRTLDT